MIINQNVKCKNQLNNSLSLLNSKVKNILDS